MPSLKDMAKKAKSKKPVVAKKEAVPVPFKSAQFVNSSDEADEDSSEDPESDDESKAADAANIVAPISSSNGNQASTEESSSSSSSEGESESSESGSSDEDEEMEEAVQPSEPAKPLEKRVAASTKLSTVYKPPHGFELADINTTSKAAQLFEPSNLKGKQIWYFTAPPSVPISSLEKMALRDIKKGKSVLSHDDNDYAFSQDSTEESTNAQVMIPTASKDGFRTVTKPVDRVLHLKQLVTLPGIDKSAPNTANPKATVPAKKPVRQQPKGLKMRFRPLGFGDGEIGKIGSSPSPGGSETESDEEMADAPQPFRRPASIEEDRPLTILPSQKAKKDKSMKKEATEGENGSSKRKHKDGEEKAHKSKKADRVSHKQSKSISVN